MQDSDIISARESGGLFDDDGIGGIDLKIGNSSQDNNLVLNDDNLNYDDNDVKKDKSSLNDFNELTESDNLNIEDINIGVRSLASNGPVIEA